MHFHFIEIGSSCFKTECHSRLRGRRKRDTELVVEPVEELLEKVPKLPNVQYVCCRGKVVRVATRVG
jgi:hypothetical protein